MNKISKLLTALVVSFSAVAGAGLSFTNKNSVSVSAAGAATYYSSIDSNLSGTDLLSALNKLNSSKKKRSVGYNGMRSFAAKSDIDPNGTSKKIVGFYDNTLVGPSWDSGNTWNREHVWPNSRKGSNVEDDAHMVRPAAVKTNGDRGNDFYAASGAYDPGQFVAEYRGIAARIIFYCAIADTSLKLVDKVTDSASNGTMGKLSDLLKWNIQYAPTTDSNANIAYRVEQNRNNVIEQDSSGQGNRNPFIDHPEYACKIWGNTNESTKSICSGNLPDIDDDDDQGGGGGGTTTTTVHAGTAADPYSVSDAVAMLDKDTNVHHVIGKVTGEIKTGKEGDYQFSLTDGVKTIKVFYAHPNGIALPKAGDIATVKGTLTDYNGTPEVNKGGDMVSVSDKYPEGWEDKGSGGGNDDDDDDGGDKPHPVKRGCGGSIAAASAIVFFTSIGGFLLALKKRKED